MDSPSLRIFVRLRSGHDHGLTQEDLRLFSGFHSLLG